MPAVSKSQQRLFGMIHAYKKGKLHAGKSLEKKLERLSDSMSDESVLHYAKTEHKDLPEKKATYLRGFIDKCEELMTKEKKAAHGHELTEKQAQLSPLNRLKFSTIQQWIKAMRGMNRKGIRAFANSEDVIKSLPVYRGSLDDKVFRETV